MARKGVDVRDELRRPIRRGGAAHAAADRDPDARRLALKRPEHQLAFDQAIEARPVEIGQELPDHRGGVGHVGDGVGLARGDRIDSAAPEIGSASCRERVCPYVWVSVVAGSLKKKHTVSTIYTNTIFILNKHK